MLNNVNKQIPARLQFGALFAILCSGFKELRESSGLPHMRYYRTDQLILTSISIKAINPLLGAELFLAFHCIIIIKNYFSEPLEDSAEACEVKIDERVPGLGNIIGLDKAKEVIEDFLLSINNPQIAQEMKCENCAPNNILLYGKPGTGKTTIARAIAKSVPGCIFLEKSASKFLNKYVGDSQRIVSELFAFARARTNLSRGARVMHYLTLKIFFKPRRCIIFMDELEAIGNRATLDISSGGSSLAKADIIRTLLTEMNDQKNKNIFVVGATNYRDQIDDAFLRDGRMDTHIECLPPKDWQERREILKIYLLGKPTSLTYKDINAIAKEADKFTGASLEQLVKRAARIAMRRFREEKYFLTRKDFNKAMDEMRNESLQDTASMMYV